MRPTDVCHPNELRAPAPRTFPAPLAAFAAGTPREVLGFARCDRGSGRFTASEDRFGRSSSSPDLALVASRPSERSVGVFFPRCERSIEPLTALSRFPFNLTPHPPSRMLQSGRPSFFWKVSDGSEDAETAKTTVDADS
jgi:hypothetical protein